MLTSFARSCCWTIYIARNESKIKTKNKSWNKKVQCSTPANKGLSAVGIRASLFERLPRKALQELIC
jgi:hypothetical protein